MANQNVLVVTGAGGMGIACVKRLAAGRKVILADVSEELLSKAVEDLGNEGFIIEAFKLDVSDYSSVEALVAKASAGGQRIETIIHTAGLSPITGHTKPIFGVDLLGTANMIQAFQTVASPGMAMVCIASMSSYLIGGHGLISDDLEQHMAQAPLSSLLSHADLDPEKVVPGIAYSIAKRGNILRVAAAAKAYGLKGAGINSISPGVIQTPKGNMELDGPSGDRMRAMIEGSPAGRAGTPFDIANAAAFLTGNDAAFVTGIDLLVDGGVVGTLVISKPAKAS
jgi:NAD(P)-dependent dehydrogenase (short-subunit alcohol dehydrogenase family)